MITAETYFSVENNMAYMGTSQFKTFLECEARGLAEAKGEYQREMTTALLVGSYVDAHFGKTLAIFKAQHPELFTQKGELKADFKHAETIIARIERDPLFMLMVSGDQQTIKTGEIAGVPFKIKIDSYLSAELCKEIVNRFPKFVSLMFADNALVDLKIMKDFKAVWCKEEQSYISFIRQWQYDLQAAVYQYIEGHNLPFFIAAATKEKKEPNIEIFEIPQEEMDRQLLRVEELAPHFAAIKRGEIEPTRCEHCDYCKSTKVLTEPKDYRFYDVVVEEEY